MNASWHGTVSIGCDVYEVAYYGAFSGNRMDPPDDGEVVILTKNGVDVSDDDLPESEVEAVIQAAEPLYSAAQQDQANDLYQVLLDEGLIGK